MIEGSYWDQRERYKPLSLLYNSSIICCLLWAVKEINKSPFVVDSNDDESFGECDDSNDDNNGGIEFGDPSGCDEEQSNDKGDGGLDINTE